eukprot:8280931-Alexandrium_andersonii.AAC.1
MSWKRNQLWLASLFGRELAWLWGAPGGGAAGRDGAARRPALRRRQLQRGESGGGQWPPAHGVSEGGPRGPDGVAL